MPTTADWLQVGIALVNLLILSGLVWITRDYVRQTHAIAESAREQAQASAAMAAEMQEQRLAGLQPLIVQEVKGAATPDSSITITIANLGAGPAIELDIFLQDETAARNRSYLGAQRRIFLGLGPHPPLRYDMGGRPAGKYYLTTEYKDIHNRRFRTVLPFSFGWEPGGRAAVEPGELAFAANPADMAAPKGQP